MKLLLMVSPEWVRSFFKTANHENRLLKPVRDN